MQEHIDKSEELTLKQVKEYAEVRKGRGEAEYNEGSILIVGSSTLDRLLHRNIIKEEHHQTGRDISNLRDCALGILFGRTYTSTGGDSPDAVDAFTKYNTVVRSLLKWQWSLIERICFGEVRENDYAWLSHIKANVQNAFEDTAKLLEEERQKSKARKQQALDIAAQPR